MLRRLQSAIKYIYNELRGVCGGEVQVRYPYYLNTYIGEYYDNGRWFPEYVWWDTEYSFGRKIPDDIIYVPKTSAMRLQYVKNQLMEIERRKLNKYSYMVSCSIMSEDRLQELLNDWYDMKKYLLDNEICCEVDIQVSEECEICFEDCCDISLVPCNHELCEVCLQRMMSLDIRVICPFCRSNVDGYYRTDKYYMINCSGVL